MKIFTFITLFLYARYVNINRKDKLIKKQEKLLKKQLSFVKENSPFYKNIKGSSLSEFPIINKKTAIDRFDDINTRGLNKEEVYDLAVKSEHTRDFKERIKGISVGLSSGTSGHRGLFVLSDEEIMSWAGYILGKMLPRGRVLFNRIAFFLRADNNLYEGLNNIFVKFVFFDLYKDEKENLKKLNSFSPTILVAPATVLRALAKAQNQKYINISPIKIISVAEVLTKEDEEYIKKAFGKDIIHQVYQCTEGFLACTCEKGNIHLNEDIVYFEKEYIDSKRFIPILTDLKRKTQPYIRYRQNDILIESDKKCPCGCCFTVVEKIEGREDDIFIFEGKNGKTVKIYPDMIARCIVYVKNIEEYKVLQTSKSTIEVYIDNSEKNIKENIVKEFEILAQKKLFLLPEIVFKKYEREVNTKKYKRIERRFSSEEC